MSESRGNARLGPEASCARCTRPYFTEPVDNGLCCICNRDDEWTARLGPDWRQRISDQDVRASDKVGFPFQTTVVTDGVLSDALHCPVYAPSGHSATGQSEGSPDSKPRFDVYD